MRPDAVFRLQRPHARWSCDVFRKCVCPSAEMGVSGFVLPQSWNSHGNKIFRTQLERGNWQQRLLQSTDGGRSICGSRTVVIETERTPCASSLTLDQIIKTCGHKKKKKTGPSCWAEPSGLVVFLYKLWFLFVRHWITAASPSPQRRSASALKWEPGETVGESLLVQADGFTAAGSEGPRLWEEKPRTSSKHLEPR